MKTSRTIATLLLALAAFNLQNSTVFSQGSLTPPGAPAPTMKTLTQVEPRTPISIAPFSISVPGSYYLTTNLTVATGDAITIAASGVTLDLNGFSISSTAASAAGAGILLNTRLRDITISNGHIRSGVTNNGSGVYSGTGFARGIYFSNIGPADAIVSQVTVSGCLDVGIQLGNNDATMVDSCSVRTVGGSGILANRIRNSTAYECGGNAIYGTEVSDCIGYSTGNGDGVHANTAQNCSGSSAGAGDGVYGSVALNCSGNSQSGSGVSANTALNCYGFSLGSGTGVHASQVANTCYGNSSSGIGLSAYIANSCRGTSTTGTPQSINFKYNMP